MEQAIQLADVLVAAAGEVAQALATLRAGTTAGRHLVEINRLENEGDRIQRDAVASLFANGIDPMVVIRWKDIFDCLESAIDATRDGRPRHRGDRDQAAAADRGSSIAGAVPGTLRPQHDLPPRSLSPPSSTALSHPRRAPSRPDRRAAALARAWEDVEGLRA